jgi:hypothetical protein
VAFTCSQWIATGYALAMTRWRVKGTIRGSTPCPFSLFTLQSSLFLPWLLLLETNTEAKDVDAGARGVGAALGGTQERPEVS